MNLHHLNAENLKRLLTMKWIFAFALLPMSDLMGQHLDVVGSARVSEMDTLPELTANMVSMSDGTLATRQFKAGDYAHGGIVFFVDESGEHGLVCDTTDIHDGIAWYNGIHRVTNATGDGIGVGAMNTMLAITMQTNDNTTGEFAALLCAELVRGGYGDWYLPSKEELNLMYTNLHLAGLGGFGEFYWSSTEDSSAIAWTQNFTNGNQSLDGKFNVISRVRAVRAF